MKRKLIEHSLSILFVGVIFAALVLTFERNNGKDELTSEGEVGEFVRLDFLDFGDPLDKSLFKESLNVFAPDSARNDSLVQAIDNYRREQFANALYKTGAEDRGLSWTRVQQLVPMYLQFISVFIIVMALSYYGAQTLGVIRFVQMKQGRSS